MKIQEPKRVCNHVPAYPMAIGWTPCELCGKLVRADSWTGLYYTFAEMSAAPVIVDDSDTISLDFPITV